MKLYSNNWYRCVADFQPKKLSGLDPVTASGLLRTMCGRFGKDSRVAAGSDRREFDCIPHRVPRIDEWAKSLHRRFGGSTAITLELATGPIVYALQKYDFFVLLPINPVTLAKHREAFKPSRAKDDPTDAELALDLLMHHPEQFAPLQPRSVAMRTLLSLTERRRELVGDKTRLTNRLTNKAKTQAINQLRALLVTAPATVRASLRKTKPGDCIAGCAALKSLGETALLKALTSTLRLLAKRWMSLAEELRELDAALDKLTRAAGRRVLVTCPR